MEDSEKMSEETPDHICEIPPFTEEDKKQFDGKMSAFVKEAEKMRESLLATAAELRTTADYLDKVWKDCRIATAVGSGTAIVGGALTIGGAISTMLTGGAASPLLFAGIAVGAAGTGTNLGTSSIEAIINSSQIQKADQMVTEANKIAEEVRKTVELWIGREKKAKLLFLSYLALHMVDIELDVMAKSIIDGILNYAGWSLVQTSETCSTALAETTAKVAGKAGTRLGAKAAGGIIMAVSTAFIVVDALEFGFTVRDLVQDKKSDAAKALRKKAREIERKLSGQ